MAVDITKFPPSSPAAAKAYQTSLAPAINLTAAIVRVIQIPYSFAVERVQAYCRVLAGAVSVLVGIVRPGTAIQAVTLVIGTTVSKFKLSAALTAVMPTRLSGALPVVVNVGVTDNIAFSQAFTINGAAALGQFWGASRIQMDEDGAITTKEASADMNYLSEADALYNVPDADPGFFDLGTITIESATGATFTAGTTSLAAAGTTVHYNGKAAGFVNVCDTNPAYVSAEFIDGDMTATLHSRAVSQIGGLLVVEITTDGTGALTDGSLDVGYRPWPMNGETAPAGT